MSTQAIRGQYLVDFHFESALEAQNVFQGLSQGKDERFMHFVFYHAVHEIVAAEVLSSVAEESLQKLPCVYENPKGSRDLFPLFVKQLLYHFPEKLKDFGLVEEKTKYAQLLDFHTKLYMAYAQKDLKIEALYEKFLEKAQFTPTETICAQKLQEDMTLSLDPETQHLVSEDFVDLIIAMSEKDFLKGLRAIPEDKGADLIANLKLLRYSALPSDQAAQRVLVPCTSFSKEDIQELEEKLGDPQS